MKLIWVERARRGQPPIAAKRRPTDGRMLYAYWDDGTEPEPEPKARPRGRRRARRVG